MYCLVKNKHYNYNYRLTIFSKYDIIITRNNYIVRRVFMINLNLFTNDTYKLLKFLYDNQIQVKEDYYVVLSQQEIADILHYSKLKTNNIMKDLRNNDFITTFNNKRGKYMITNKGYKVIEVLEKRY